MTNPTLNDISYRTAVRFPKAEGYNLRVGDQWFRTVTGPGYELTVGTRDSLAPRIQQTPGNITNVLEVGHAWGRTDLSGGEGLDWDPRELALERDQVALDQIRYWDSNGIKTSQPPSGERYVLRLAEKLIDWGGVIDDPIDMDTSDEFIFIADGAIIRWYDAWDDVAPIQDTLPSIVRSIAVSPNNTCVAVCADGNAYAMRNYPTESVFTLAYGDGGNTKLEAHGVWYANGRFFLSTFDDDDAAELRTLEYGGGTWTESLLDAATSPFWSVVESGPAIVAACGDGTVRTYTPDLQDAALPLEPKSRLTMPQGEAPILLGSNAGVLLIGTTAAHAEPDRDEVRLYQAEVLDARFNFVVGQLQLRREWKAAAHQGLVTRNMTNTRDEILFFVKEEDQYTGLAVDESLWRFDVVTNGLTRVFTEPNVDLNGLIVFDQIIGGLDFAGSTIMVTNPNLHQIDGWMIFPNLTFGLNTDISWIATVFEATNLVEGGAQARLLYSINPDAINDRKHSSWTIAQTVNAPGGTSVEVPLVGVKSRTLSLQLQIQASAQGARSPWVSRTAVRGFPAHRDLVMLVPVDVSDYPTAPGRKPHRIAGLGDSIHQSLLEMVGNSVDAQLIDPTVLFRGVVNNISEPIEHLARRGSVTRYCLVELRGQRVTQSSTAVGNEGIGLGWMGLSTMGLDEAVELTP